MPFDDSLLAAVLLDFVQPSPLSWGSGDLQQEGICKLKDHKWCVAWGHSPISDRRPWLWRPLPGLPAGRHPAGWPAALRRVFSQRGPVEQKESGSMKTKKLMSIPIHWSVPAEKGNPAQATLGAPSFNANPD